MVKQGIAHVEDKLIMVDEDVNNINMLESRLDTCIEELGDLEDMEDISEIFQDVMDKLRDKVKEKYPDQDWTF